MKKTLFIACSAIALGFGSAAAAQDMSFSLTNESDATMVELRVGESSNDEWDIDLLDDEDVGPGDTVEVSIEDDLEDCTYDIQAVYDDGDTEELYDVDICELNDLDVEDDNEDEEEDEDDSDDEDEDEDEDEDDSDDEDEDEEEDEEEEE